MAATPDKRFFFTLLKVTVTIVVAAVTTAYFLTRMLLRFGADVLGQAKDATPGVAEELKAHAKVVKSNAPKIAGKAQSDLRKAFKITHLKAVPDEDAA